MCRQSQVSFIKSWHRHNIQIIIYYVGIFYGSLKIYPLQIFALKLIACNKEFILIVISKNIIQSTIFFQSENGSSHNLVVILLA